MWVERWHYRLSFGVSIVPPPPPFNIYIDLSSDYIQDLHFFLLFTHFNYIYFFGHKYSWGRLPMAEYVSEYLSNLHLQLRTWWHLITAAGPTCTNMLRSCMGYFRKWPKCRTGWKLRIVRCWCRNVSTFWFWFVGLPVRTLLFRPPSSIRFMYVSLSSRIHVSHGKLLSWLYIGNMYFRGWGFLLG